MPALPQPAPVTVLIVEDEPVIRLYEAELAEGAGYIALAASNADEALEALEASAQIEILLTDVRMPGSMDGLALAEAVPNRWPDKMIVIASGHVDRADEARKLNAILLPKPFTPNDLIEVLQRATSRREPTQTTPAI
jgi:two-component system, response regulator PdtaR